MIRPVLESNAKSIAEIYNYYILNTIVTFEEEVIDENEMRKRINEVTPEYPWLVFIEDEEILGYAYANKWNNRIGYRMTAESTIYLKHNAAGKGIGSELYLALIDQLIKKDMHSIIGGIAIPNQASISLHEKLGYKKAAHYKEVGKKFGQWIDVVYYQKIIK